VISPSKPRWQQVTALVSLSASGTITGFSFVPSAPADLMSPASMPIRLMALERSATPAAANDAALRSAIVNVANYYLKMAQGKTPAEMEAIIWQHDSIDGVDHGESCAAFASLTLELAAQVVGQQSWVTGGTSYPWPLHKWADVRVDTNPDSPNIISVLQDAQVHGRWQPLGDGYQPQPGDWVLFDGHVEVVTKYADGVLSTIGGDSLPNFSVNAHEYPGPLAAQGVVGFVNNGDLTPAPAAPAPASGQATGQAQAPTSAAAIPGQPTGSAAAPTGTVAVPGEPAVAAAQPAAAHSAPAQPSAAQQASSPAIPGLPTAAASPAPAGQQSRHHPRGGHWHASHASPSASQAAAPGTADVPGADGDAPTSPAAAAATSGAAVPGLPSAAQQRGGAASASPAPYRRHRPPASAVPSQATSAQQAFINAIAPGALATQRRFGVPAAVTIAQAIDESGWGQSSLALNDHNLFGIKGTGPAGSDILPTEEYENGQWVTANSAFRVYHNFAESIEDHGELLATSGYYTQAMADRTDPDAFANALTGVYATNPSYGSDLIQLMQQYNLYRYDAAPTAARPAAPRPAAKPRPSRPAPAPTATTAPTAPSPSPTQPQPSPTGTQPSPSPSQPSPSGSQPSPGTSQPSPEASPPTAGGSGPSATPTGPSPGATAPSSPGPSATGSASSPGAAGAAPGGSAASPSIPGLWPTAPGPSGIAAGSAPAGATRGAPARPPSRARTHPVSGDVSEPATQSFSYQHLSADMPPIETAAVYRLSGPAERVAVPPTPRKSSPRRVLYRSHLPPSVKSAFAGLAKAPLERAELVYRDVAGRTGIPWELLAACDWMQCEARPRYSPVHGEKLGAVNLDGTVYRTKSAALEQCAYDLIDLAGGVYGIDVTGPGDLAVGDLASVFAAFRWGGLLRQHHTSAMEFPYSVAGLTIQHLSMRWPNIDESSPPDKPGARFRMAFGAVPVVLSLNYPALA
jgi:flagellum-specific peptidoglycan hydrolase FlgJ